MFGTFRLPLTWHHQDITIEIQRQGTHHRYLRQQGEKSVSKLLVDPREVIIHPVEPLHTPYNLTPYLLVEVDEPVWVGPDEEAVIFTNFPMEIGVFLKRDGGQDLLDVFSPTPGKFTLYGDPSDGHVCKYLKTPIYESPPEPASPFDGMLKLHISNELSRWNAMRRVVLNAYGMKIFYRKNGGVGCSARMRLTSRNVAETSFEATPPHEQMHKAQELFELGKLNVSTPKRYTMDKEYA